MIHASLFSGFGGFDLAAEWVGWTNLFNCEIDPFCRRILAYHFPYAKQYEDIRTTDFSIWRGRVDVLTGGFPCQPFSIAGKRRGTEDERYLWPEMLRAIREIRPCWIVGENVLGIVSWSDGMVFEQVHADLEAEGYEVEAYVLPACGVGAPHRRYRTWFVAHRADAGTEGMRERQEQADRHETAPDPESDGCGRQGRGNGRESNEHGLLSRECKGNEVRSTTDRPCSKRPIINTECFGRNPRGIHDGQSNASSKGECCVVESFGADRTQDWWRQFPSQSPVCCGDDGLPERLDGITFPAWRRASIRGFGNAIVPQVAVQLFKVINRMKGGEPMK